MSEYNENPKKKSLGERVLFFLLDCVCFVAFCCLVAWLLNEYIDSIFSFLIVVPPELIGLVVMLPTIIIYFVLRAIVLKTLANKKKDN